jgi:hypothetical protein
VNPSSARRTAAALAIFAYVGGTTVAPLVHILSDHSGRHVARAPESIDPEQFRNGRTGHVDLQRLAVALGLDGSASESSPHSHTPGGPPPSDPTRHGAGSLQHFGAAILASAASPIPIVSPAPVPPPAPLPAAPSPTLSLRHLRVQRAQAPPV